MHGAVQLEAMQYWGLRLFAQFSRVLIWTLVTPSGAPHRHPVALRSNWRRRAKPVVSKSLLPFVGGVEKSRD